MMVDHVSFAVRMTEIANNISRDIKGRHQKNCATTMVMVLRMVAVRHRAHRAKPVQPAGIPFPVCMIRPACQSIPHTNEVILLGYIGEK